MSEPLKYTDKDFASLRAEMVARIPQTTPRWTDYNQSDVGITLLELTAFAVSQLLFYLDNAANEAYLPLARQRRNVINLTKLLGYRLDGVTSSTAVVRFSLAAAHTHRIEIPKGARVATAAEEVLHFVTTAISTLAVGDTEVLVGVRQGVPKSESFQTDGTQSQRYRLADSAADRSSVEVIIDGTIWTQVDSFISYEASDRVYLVEIDGVGNVEILFGDGFNGLAPVVSSVDNLKINYLASSGLEGNVGSGTITKILSPIFDVLSVPVSLSVVNTQAATGGADEETIDHAREQAPAELSALFRAMTAKDYESLLEGYPGVLKAGAWGEQDENPPDYNLYNWVMLSVTPDGVTRAALVADPANNGKPSDQLKADLLEFLEERKCITTRLKILDPVYVGVDVEANVFYMSGALSSTVKADVEDAIINFFDPETMPFGKEIRRSNIIRLMDATAGVSYVEVTKLKTDASPTDLEESLEHKRFELPFLRTLTITVAKAEDTPLRAGTYPCPPEPPAPPEEQ